MSKVSLKGGLTLRLAVISNDRQCFARNDSGCCFCKSKGCSKEEIVPFGALVNIQDLMTGVINDGKLSKLIKQLFLLLLHVLSVHAVLSDDKNGKPV